MADRTRESKGVDDSVRCAFGKYQEVYWLQLVSNWRGECCYGGGGENHADGQERIGFRPVSPDVAPSCFRPRDAVRV